VATQQYSLANNTNLARVAVQQLSDSQLLSAAKKGDNAAFGQLFERHSKKIFHSTLRITRNREDAEDALQDCFLSGLLHLNDFDGRSQLSTWLTRIAINESLMLLRKRRPGHLSIEGHQSVDEESYTLEIKDPAVTPEERYGQKEIQNVLSGAIDELRPILKTVVNLSEIAELSTRKTAEALGVRVGTVKARTFRARRLLRDKIAKRLGARNGRVSAALFSSSQAPRRSAYQAVFSTSAG